MRTLKQVATNMADAFTRFGLWKGGGSSLNAEITELWSGQQSSSSEITLSDDYANYDVIISMTEPIVDATWQQKFDFMLNSEKSLTGGMAANGEYISLYSLTNWSGTSVHFNVLNNPPRDWHLTLRKIWGIKFVSQQHEYSTEEKVVGKWIDGKPIYEKVIPFTSTLNQSAWVETPELINDKEQILQTFGIFTTSYIPLMANINRNDSAYVRVWNLRNMTFPITHVIMQYTKTTD